MEACLTRALCSQAPACCSRVFPSTLFPRQMRSPDLDTHVHSEITVSIVRNDLFEPGTTENLSANHTDPGPTATSTWLSLPGSTCRGQSAGQMEARKPPMYSVVAGAGVVTMLCQSAHDLPERNSVSAC